MEKDMIPAGIPVQSEFHVNLLKCCLNKTIQLFSKELSHDAFSYNIKNALRKN